MNALPRTFARLGAYAFREIADDLDEFTRDPTVFTKRPTLVDETIQSEKTRTLTWTRAPITHNIEKVKQIVMYSPHPWVPSKACLETV